jgi:predicted TIM-barrel fold metal-dependent hydrolase
MTVEIPPIISVDDHVVEPRDLWQRWLPVKHREAGPRVLRSAYAGDAYHDHTGTHSSLQLATDGPVTDFWIYEDLCKPIPLPLCAAGMSAEEIKPAPISYDEMRPGCWSLKARLEDMTLNHIERSLCFPTFPRFCGQTFLEAKDKELALACVKAFNDWMVEEWCGDSGGRLIPLQLIPLWDVGLAVAEVRRNAARGVRAMAFTELPHALGLPSIHDRDGYWETLWAECSDAGTVVCIHVGSSSTIMTTSPDATVAVRTSLSSINSQLAMIDWLLSGVLPRHPHIKVAFSESQLGWMPYTFERVDNIWRDGYALMELDPALVEKPSSYVKGRVYGCFFEDNFGLESRDKIGVDQITFESDYPHQDTTWPNTRAYAEYAMASLSPEEVWKICRGNAIEMLKLPAELPAMTVAAGG